MKTRMIPVLAVTAGLTLSGVLMADDDPFLWLEDVEGERALEWAEQQNDQSLEYLKSHPLFDPIHERALEILTSEDRIAYPSLMGGQIYNFWRDDTHVRGIWRTTSRENYRETSPEWDLILDLDKLAEEEDENWVWAGANCRYPDYDRCIIGLSRGGADAAVRREFDLGTREFVEDGFQLDESKSFISWRDRNSVFLAPAYEEEEMTTSEYPRRIYVWERGTERSEAELVFEGEKNDVLVTATRFWDKETAYDMIIRLPSFFERHYYLYRDGETHRIPVPDDADLAGVLDGRLLVELKSDWQVGEETYRQGGLLAATIDSLMAGEPDFELLFQPGERQAVDSVAVTENTVLVNVLDNVVGELLRFTRTDDGW